MLEIKLDFPSDSAKHVATRIELWAERTNAHVWRDTAHGKRIMFGAHELTDAQTIEGWAKDANLTAWITECQPKGWFVTFK